MLYASQISYHKRNENLFAFVDKNVNYMAATLIK